jgi:Uma2 family endonuclease
MTRTEFGITSVTISDDAQPERDLFRYGWRYIHHPLPSGGETLERVPLTLEDVLHPQEGDFVTHTDDHQRFCVYLYNVLRGLFLHQSTTVVLHDVLVGWDVPELNPHGPDIAVIFGVRERRNWGKFDVAQEGVRPALIIEVTSPETRQVDLYNKLIEYDQAGVPMYIIVDTHQRKGVMTRRLLGYQMTPEGYAGMAQDERGWLWMDSVELWIGIHENRVECYDRTGNKIEDYEGVMAARDEAEVRTQAAEARLAELEAELLRLPGES